MTDPVAEAAAQIAAQQSPGLIEEIKEGMHDLAEKVEHILHPEAGTAGVGEPSQDASMNNAQIVETTQTSATVTEKADLPNAASGAAEPTAGPASAPNADGADTISLIGANSVDERFMLPTRIAQHLEAIYALAKNHVEAAPAAAIADTTALKTHVGDILHRISNGIAVTEGELVQKLEALYHML